MAGVEVIQPSEEIGEARGQGFRVLSEQHSRYSTPASIYMLRDSNPLKRCDNQCCRVSLLSFPELSRVSEITGNGNKHHTCDILPQVRAPVVSHDLNGIQVILGDVVINDKVNAGNDQLIHHINALCYRVLVICFKERSCFGIQLLWIKTVGKKVSKNI